MEENYIHIELLDRFMRGMTSPEEEKRLLEWFRGAHSKEEMLAFYKRKWEEVSGRELSAEVQGRMFHAVKTRMRAAEEASKEVKVISRKSVFRRWWSYAAVVVVCVSLGIGSHLLTRHLSREALKEYVVSADKGQRASLILPDGTKVWLNSDTRIIYDTEYGHKDRLVNLSGEAYFEVAKDQKNRFIVRTGGMEVEALGTVFNIKAYNEDKEWIATLFEGSIRAKAGNQTATLSPDQHVRFDKESERLKVERLENSSYARMWRENELAFRGETLGNIAVLLNRMYNVHIEFKSEKIKHYRFSGVIKNNSLENIIEIISLTAPILYESRGDTISLSEK